jgi:outer membrane protein
MKKIVTIVVVALSLVFAASNQTKAQSKIGYISLNELIAGMPEAKKADSSLQEFQAALSDNFENMKKELDEENNMLNSKDTAKYTKAQLEIKRKTFGEQYLKLQGYQQQASQQMQQKQQDLVAPIQKKALDAVQAVAKENGYTYVFAKDALLTYPPADDLLPLVKKKLNIK